MEDDLPEAELGPDLTATANMAQASDSTTEALDSALKTFTPRFVVPRPILLKKSSRLNWILNIEKTMDAK